MVEGIIKKVRIKCEDCPCRVCGREECREEQCEECTGYIYETSNFDCFEKPEE